MYRPPSESLKHKSANAKRTASILRGIAELPDLSTTDQNTLAKAARVLDSIASHKAKEAAATRKAEQKRDKALAAALPDAMRLVMLWPAGSWLDQLAIIRTQPEWGWVAESLNDRTSTAGYARRLIADYLQQARTAEAQSIAWGAANGRGDVATLEAQRRVTLDRAREDAQTQIAALRVEAIMEAEQVAA
jgi:hypothetical protein